MASAAKSRRSGSASKGQPSIPNQEPLKLPPSQLDIKRDRLAKLYHKKAEKQRLKELNKAKEVKESEGIVDKAKALVEGKQKRPNTGRDWVADQYEKNKQNNLHSNIQLHSESIISSARSSFADKVEV